MPTRRRKLTRDARGSYRPYIGWVITLGPLIRDGEISPTATDGCERKQYRFNLGQDQREAELRYAAIQKIYEENCRETGEDCWSPLALSHARQLANGHRSIQLKPQAGDEPVDYKQLVQLNRRLFPSLAIVPKDQAAYAESVALNKDLVADELKQLEAKLKELGALDGNSVLPDKLISGTFYDALASYKTEIENNAARLDDGTLKQHSRNRLERLVRFKANHEDFPLYELTFDKMNHVVSFWRNRPLTKKGTRCSTEHARHHINELVSFFKWLDTTDSYNWTMPRGTIKRKVARLESDNKNSIVSKPVYSPDELATLSTYATQWKRLAFFVGLNCAMGAAELGRLLLQDVLLNHRHEYAERLGFNSTEDDSFIRTFRPKTNSFGEWVLWPETVEVLKWAIARAKKLKSEYIFVRKSGNPLYNEKSKNPGIAFSNLWNGLVKRTQRHHEAFRHLPFGTLRDTLPDKLRHTHSDELASLCLAHGSPTTADSLLDCYGNRPYGRLHIAIRELRPHFIAALSTPPDS